MLSRFHLTPAWSLGRRLKKRLAGLKVGREGACSFLFGKFFGRIKNLSWTFSILWFTRLTLARLPYIFRIFTKRMFRKFANLQNYKTCKFDTNSADSAKIKEENIFVSAESDWSWFKKRTCLATKHTIKTHTKNIKKKENPAPEVQVWSAVSSTFATSQGALQSFHAAADPEALPSFVDTFCTLTLCSNCLTDWQIAPVNCRFSKFTSDSF